MRTYLNFLTSSTKSSFLWRKWEKDNRSFAADASCKPLARPLTQDLYMCVERLVALPTTGASTAVLPAMVRRTDAHVVVSQSNVTIVKSVCLGPLFAKLQELPRRSLIRPMASSLVSVFRMVTVELLRTVTSQLPTQLRCQHFRRTPSMRNYNLLVYLPLSLYRLPYLLRHLWFLSIPLLLEAVRCEPPPFPCLSQRSQCPFQLSPFQFLLSLCPCQPSPCLFKLTKRKDRHGCKTIRMTPRTRKRARSDETELSNGSRSPFACMSRTMCQWSNTRPYI